MHACYQYFCTGVIVRNRPPVFSAWDAHLRVHALHGLLEVQALEAGGSRQAPQLRGPPAGLQLAAAAHATCPAVTACVGCNRCCR